mgnify:CR=1 FL=1
MPELDRKAATVFAGKVVRKDLVRKVKSNKISPEDFAATPPSSPVGSPTSVRARLREPACD